MKLYSLITKLLLFPYIFLCQGVITNTLHEKILQDNSTSLIPIVIEIHDNFDLLNLKKILKTIKYMLKKEHLFCVTHFKKLRQKLNNL